MVKWFHHSSMWVFFIFLNIFFFLLEIDEPVLWYYLPYIPCVFKRYYYYYYSNNLIAWQDTDTLFESSNFYRLFGRKTIISVNIIYLIILNNCFIHVICKSNVKFVLLIYDFIKFIISCFIMVYHCIMWSLFFLLSSDIRIHSKTWRV